MVSLSNHGGMQKACYTSYLKGGRLILPVNDKSPFLSYTPGILRARACATMLFKAVSRMKAGLGAAYSIFLLVVTTVGVITLLYFFVNSTSSPTALEWLAVVGIVIVIYVAGIAASLAGLHAIEKIFKHDKNSASRRRGT